MEVLREFWLRLTAAIGTMQWYDILDIILVSYLIYKAIQIVRDTRAMTLLKGIFIIGVVYVMVRAMNLGMMGILFDSVVLQVGIISVIVLFQQEIRHAIEKIGRSKLSDLHFGLSNDAEHEQAMAKQAISAVAEACQRLKQQKMGALIVFERNNSLNEVVSSGTVVSGTPSAELIGNIFFNKAPLHDGAMVIRENKVYAAGCILPLTQNTDISSDLGTRHRAAIGMSEASDALVVVVSEETGCISIAQKGVLTRNYSKETLIETLEEILVSGKTPSVLERKLFSKSSKKEETKK